MIADREWIAARKAAQPRMSGTAWTALSRYEEALNEIARLSDALERIANASSDCMSEQERRQLAHETLHPEDAAHNTGTERD